MGSFFTARANDGRITSSDVVADAETVSADDVTMGILSAEEFAEINTNKTDALTGTDILWTHGNTAILETSNVYSLKTYGWGGVVTAPATKSPKYAWVHFSVPTPVQLSNTNAKLKRIFVSADLGGTIEQVDLWDGANRILVKKGSVGGNMLNTPLMIEFSQPVTISKGLGISVKVGGCLFDAQGCGPSKSQISAVGAEFIRQ
jgi:hypothetical protein